MSEGNRTGPRIAVLARGEAEGQYSHPKANTTGWGHTHTHTDNSIQSIWLV